MILGVLPIYVYKRSSDDTRSAPHVYLQEE